MNRDELRAAVYGADPNALVDALNQPAWPDYALQLVGEAVLAAAQQRGPDVEAAARRCVEALRERDWEGDDDLAAQIDAALGWGPELALQPIPINLEDLAGILEGDPAWGGGRIHLRTGEVWPQSVLEYGDLDLDPDDEDDLDDPEVWLHVHSEGSRAGYRDMERFIANLPDEGLADRLARSLGGRGAFRRFKDALADSPELLELWYAFEDERQRGRARAWLAFEGYAPQPAPRGVE